MERNIKLELAYDGTDFHGWQAQPGYRTVQEEIERVARRVLNHPVQLIGASRTDAGVHARGQVANLVTTGSIPVGNIYRAIAHRVPEDIGVLSATEVGRDFHASRAAHGKQYRYRIYNATIRPVADLATRYTWHVWHPLDPDRMRAAAGTVVGTHDFSAFATTGSQRKTTVRTIRRIDIRREARELWIEVEGDGFLYNQVRNMVGTLVEIGRGHWPVERMPEILGSRNRQMAGPTAPPQGLCLQWVRYAALPATGGAEGEAAGAPPPAEPEAASAGRQPDGA